MLDIFWQYQNDFQKSVITKLLKTSQSTMGVVAPSRFKKTSPTMQAKMGGDEVKPYVVLNYKATYLAFAVWNNNACPYHTYIS